MQARNVRVTAAIVLLILFAFSTLDMIKLHSFAVLEVKGIQSLLGYRNEEEKIQGYHNEEKIDHLRTISSGHITASVAERLQELRASWLLSYKPQVGLETDMFFYVTTPGILVITSATIVASCYFVLDAVSSPRPRGWLPPPWARSIGVPMLWSTAELLGSWIYTARAKKRLSTAYIVFEANTYAFRIVYFIVPIVTIVEWIYDASDLALPSNSAFMGFSIIAILLSLFAAEAPSNDS
jgi:hypothetical protein